MQLKIFLKNLGVGFRIHELVFVSMPVCTLLYGIVSIQQYLNWILIGAFFISLLICLRYLIPIGIDSLLGKIRRITPYDIPIQEISDLAKKLEYTLDPKPFWIINKKKLTAKAHRERKRITFGKDYFDQLTSEEKIFVGGHEFFHLFGKQDHYLAIIMFPVGAIMLVIPHFIGVPVPIIFLGFIGSLILSGIFASRSFELLADQAGRVNVNREIAASALKKAYPGRTDRGFYFHPSIDKRIEKL